MYFAEYFSKHSNVSLRKKVSNQEIIGLFSSACIAENFALGVKYIP